MFHLQLLTEDFIQETLSDISSSSTTTINNTCLVEAIYKLPEISSVKALRIEMKKRHKSINLNTQIFKKYFATSK